MGNYLLKAKTDPSVTLFPQDDLSPLRSSLSLRSEGRQALSRDRCVSCHPRMFLSAFANLFIYYLATADRTADRTADKTADRSGIYNMKIRSKEVEKQQREKSSWCISILV
jgi:hypothetical protein